MAIPQWCRCMCWLALLEDREGIVAPLLTRAGVQIAALQAQ